jgi:hypothetical protein
MSPFVRLPGSSEVVDHAVAVNETTPSHEKLPLITGWCANAAGTNARPQSNTRPLNRTRRNTVSDPL